MVKNLTRFFFAFFILSFIAIPCFALPLPDETFTRQEAIDTFFKDKPENPLEGIWITDDSKYEIAIVKNDFPLCQGYDYVGFTVQTTDPAWTPGKIKIQMKTTAIPNLFTGFWHKKTDGFLTLTDEQSVGSMLRIPLNNILEYSNEKKERRLLFRIYPGNVDPSNGIIRSGTGFFITSNLIVTNNHVIENAKSVEIKYDNGQKAAATVITKDPINDLALLKVSKSETAVTPLSIAAMQDPKDGDTVYTIGFPMPTILGTKPKLSEGIINSTTGLQDDVRMLQISIPTQPGNSGGPLLNTKGQVVGVVTATINPYRSLQIMGTLPQNVNFAMKINYIDGLLSSSSEEIHLPTKKASNDLTPAQIMKLVKEGIVQIEVK